MKKVFGITCNWMKEHKTAYSNYDHGMDIQFIFATSEENAREIYDKYVETQEWDKELTRFNVSELFPRTEQELLSSK